MPSEGGATLKGNHILITTEPGEAGATRRVAIIEDGELVEVHFERPPRGPGVGSIYLGRVQAVLPGMGAAFVDVGEGKALFLSEQELSESLLRSRGLEPGKDPVPIGKALRAGDPVTIQVRREGIGKKNPQGTTKISLPGRYWVYLPTQGRLGVSRRVEDPQEAQRLRGIARELRREGEGLIARTAAVGASPEELERDLRYLRDQWAEIEARAQAASPPVLLYRPPDLVRTLIRDRFLDGVSSVLVDDEELRDEILAYLNELRLPDLRRRVRLYRGTVPLFVRFDIERRLREVLGRKIPLRGGGFLVVDEAEALTAIDVNTGSDVRHRRQSSAILNTNLEAARTIPRILRLRKISGIILVDFVDMEDERDLQKVIETLQAELRKDRVPADFIDVTKLGLVEITRRREGESLLATLEEPDEA